MKFAKSTRLAFAPVFKAALQVLAGNLSLAAVASQANDSVQRDMPSNVVTPLASPEAGAPSRAGKFRVKEEAAMKPVARAMNDEASSTSNRLMVPESVP